MYLNDINHIFSGRGCNSPKIRRGDTNVHCLLNADDLLILSETAQVLQNNLNKLSIYCKTWHLQRNIKKTKVMIFSNRRPEIVKFFYDTESIAISDKYTYLGVQFTRNGTLKEAVSVLCDKVMKGMLSLCSSLYIGRTITQSFLLKVFYSTIRPILAYGYDVWLAELLKLICHNQILLIRLRLRGSTTHFVSTLLVCHVGHQILPLKQN